MSYFWYSLEARHHTNSFHWEVEKILPCFIRAPPTNVGGDLLFLACLSVRCRGHSNSHFESDFFQIPFLDCFNQSPSSSNNAFCLRKDNQDGRQNGPHLSMSTVMVTFKLEYGFCPMKDNQDG